MLYAIRKRSKRKKFIGKGSQKNFGAFLKNELNFFYLTYVYNFGMYMQLMECTFILIIKKDHNYYISDPSGGKPCQASEKLTRFGDFGLFA